MQVQHVVRDQAQEWVYMETAAAAAEVQERKETETVAAGQTMCHDNKEKRRNQILSLSMSHETNKCQYLDPRMFSVGSLERGRRDNNLHSKHMQRKK